MKEEELSEEQTRLWREIIDTLKSIQQDSKEGLMDEQVCNTN